MANFSYCAKLIVDNKGDDCQQNEGGGSSETQSADIYSIYLRYISHISSIFLDTFIYPYKKRVDITVRSSSF